MSDFSIPLPMVIENVTNKDNSKNEPVPQVPLHENFENEAPPISSIPTFSANAPVEISISQGSRRSNLVS